MALWCVLMGHPVSPPAKGNKVGHLQDGEE